MMTNLFTIPSVPQNELGLNEEKVKGLVNYCRDEDSDELILISENGMFHENYTNTDQPIALNSLTKVFAGTAIGLLLDDGLIPSLHIPISTYFTDYKSKEMGEVTLWHILTHTSGIHTDGHDNELSAAPDIAAYVLNLPMTDVPGTVSKYNNEAVGLLSEIVRKITGKTMDQYLNEKLFVPLGIEQWEWIKDKSNNPLAYAGLSLKGIDLAKFAYLYLNNGIWQGKRILSESWIDAATHPTQTIDRNWGYLWLTAYREDTYIGYGMSGFGGKYLLVSPKENFIAIRLVHRREDIPAPSADLFFKYAIDIIVN